MAQINKIQVDSNEYDVKDSFSRPIILDRDANVTVTLPDSMTMQDLLEVYQKGKPVWVKYNNRMYVAESIYRTGGGSYISSTFVTTYGNALAYIQAMTGETSTTIVLTSMTTTYLVQGTKSLISSSLSRTASTTATIPTGYENGTLLVWGRPNGGTTGYIGLDIPLGVLSSTQKKFTLADDSNQINYSITKSGSVLTFTFGSASSTTGVWTAVYIMP